MYVSTGEVELILFLRQHLQNNDDKSTSHDHDTEGNRTVTCSRLVVSVRPQIDSHTTKTKRDVHSTTAIFR